MHFRIVQVEEACTGTNALDSVETQDHFAKPLSIAQMIILFHCQAIRNRCVILHAHLPDCGCDLHPKRHPA